MTGLHEIVRREARVWDATFFLTLGWIVFGALPLVAILTLSLCNLVLLARMVCGYLRIVPPSWREYRDDDGAVVAPRDVPRDAAKPWDGIARLAERDRR